MELLEIYCSCSWGFAAARGDLLLLLLEIFYTYSWESALARGDLLLLETFCYCSYRHLHEKIWYWSSGCWWWPWW